MCTDCHSYKLFSLFIPRCLVKCFGLLLATPVLSSTPFIFEGSPLICCLFSKKMLYYEPLGPKWTSLQIPHFKTITWMPVTQFPCITMSPIIRDYWLRTLPCSLSTNLVLEAALSCRASLDSPWQEDHPLQGRKMGFFLKTEYHI